MDSKWKKACWILVLAVCARQAGAQVYTGTRIEKNGGVNGYHLSMGNYFNTTEREILACSKSGVPPEELPVVFFIAHQAGVSPAAVIGLHTRGMSWMKIAGHFNLSPRVFYVPIEGNIQGSLYKRIYAHYQEDKSRIRLTDSDIINLVNLKFMSDHYGHDPREIIQMRSKGKTFPDIDDTFRQEKEDMRWDAGNTPLEVKDSEGRPDPRKADKNSLNSARHQ